MHFVGESIGNVRYGTLFSKLFSKPLKYLRKTADKSQSLNFAELFFHMSGICNQENKPLKISYFRERSHLLNLNSGHYKRLQNKKGLEPQKL